MIFLCKLIKLNVKTNLVEMTTYIEIKFRELIIKWINNHEVFITCP